MIVGSIIMFERRFAGSLQDSESMIIIDEDTVKANPMLVINLAPLLPRRIRTQDRAKGISKTPTPTVRAICNSFGVMLNP